VTEVPLDDPALLQAIREMTVEASRLEHHVAYVVAIARDEDEAWLSRTLGKPGGALDALASLARVVPADHQFAALLDRLLRDAKAVLRDRSVVVHSVGMLDVSDPAVPRPVWWHPRSDTEPELIVSSVRLLAHDLRRRASVRWRCRTPQQSGVGRTCRIDRVDGGSGQLG
jgi:hypothetical protein